MKNISINFSPFENRSIKKKMCFKLFQKKKQVTTVIKIFIINWPTLLGDDLLDIVSCDVSSPTSKTLIYHTSKNHL